jgi:hypothetical protein
MPEKRTAGAKAPGPSEPQPKPTAANAKATTAPTTKRAATGLLVAESAGAQKPRPAIAPGAPALAREPDLVGAIRRDIASVGLVGESDAGLLVYLAYSSRKLRNPLGAVVMGPSGSGKDEIQRRPADLMPEEDVIDAMSITPQSLYSGCTTKDACGSAAPGRRIETSSIALSHARLPDRLGFRYGRARRPPSSRRVRAHGRVSSRVRADDGASPARDESRRRDALVVGWWRAVKRE